MTRKSGAMFSLDSAYPDQVLNDQKYVSVKDKNLKNPGLQ